jgi:multiple sugar transport system ATP-binding protein
MATVNLKHLNKIYPSNKGSVHAVKDLNMQIADGEFVALLGPSGCGKTSTLRMVVGLEEITSGSVAFNDVVVNELSPEKRNVAMAFETYALYPNFTVSENIGFPLEVRGIEIGERKKKVEEIAGMLQITELLGHKPTQLSGGQQQRVSLGRALIRDPDVFILDEVLSHLDAHLKFQMLFELKRIHQSLGKTMIFVTHDQMEALALADRVAVMADAELQQLGDRNDLYHKPANKFVADFIGEPATNFMKASLLHEKGKYVMKCGNGDLGLYPDEERCAAMEKYKIIEATIGIRPQNISLNPVKQGYKFKGEVLINEFLGERSILEVQCGEILLKVLAPPQTGLRRGDIISLHYHPRDVMIFHLQTEKFIN